jgi:glucan 1,3-beta-glucosidase
MLFFYVAILAALALGGSCARSEIPQVESVVDDILHDYEKFVHYSATQNNDTLVSEVVATPYWYETIAHQGISAFGPSGYRVFRNVKDYGARGSFNISIDKKSQTLHILTKE